MSDTQDDAPAPPPLPNFAIAPATVAFNNRTAPGWVVSFGEAAAPRRIEVVRPDLGDQLDLAEMAGEKMTVHWLGLAMGAMAAKSVDGQPMFTPDDKNGLKHILRKLGEDGLRAVNYALAQDRAHAADPASAAKNSFGTPASVS